MLCLHIISSFVVDRVYVSDLYFAVCITGLWNASLYGFECIPYSPGKDQRIAAIKEILSWETVCNFVNNTLKHGFPTELLFKVDLFTIFHGVQKEVAHRTLCNAALVVYV